jgi:hypothetical protein
MTRPAHAVAIGRSKPFADGFALAVLLLGSGCTDEDERSVLRDFEASACQREDRQDRAGDAGTSTADDPSNGCVEWHLDSSNTLQLTFAGISALCLENDLLRDVPWQPSATRSASDRLELAVVWPSESTPGCGECRYDFSFSVEASRWEDPLQVELEVRSCPSCARETRVVTLPVPDSDTSQVTCPSDAG